MTRSRRTVVVVLAIAASAAAPSQAGEPVPVEVSLRTRAPVRVRISEGATVPCDASTNRVLFDGWLADQAVFRTTIASETICVEHTWDDYPRAGWAPAGLAHRPKICLGRRCVPAPDPTIRVALDATRH